MPEAMNSRVQNSENIRQSTRFTWANNGQQRLFLTPIEESAVSDTSGSLLSALRARHCYLKFSVTVATVTLNGAMRKINLANNLANKAAIQKICTAHETLQFQNQRESSGCGVIVLSRITNAVPEIHVGHSKIIACWNDIYVLSEALLIISCHCRQL